MKKNIFCIFIIISVLMIFFAPFLFLKQAFADADSLLQGYLLYIYKQQAGGSIKWVPEILGGYFNPFWTRTISLTYAINFFYLFTNKVFTAYHWLVFSCFSLGAFSCFILAKKLKFSYIISLTISFCYILSEFCIYRGRLFANAHYFFFLPLLFYLILKLKENKKIDIIILGVVIGLLTWIISVQFLLYSILAGLLFIIFIDWQDYDCAQSFFSNWKMLKKYIIVGIITVLISFPYLYDFLDFSKSTAFNSGFTANSVANNAGINLIDLLRFLSPYLQIEGYSTFPALLYLGTFSFLLILVEIFYGWKNKTKEKYNMPLFFSFLFFFFLFLSFNNSPLFYLLSSIPLLNRFRNQSRFLFVVAFSGAFLSGYGIRYLAEQKGDIAKLMKVLDFFIIFSIIGAFIVNAISIFWQKNIILWTQKYFENNIYNNSKAFPLAYYNQVISDRIKNLFYLFYVGNLKFLVPFSFLLIGYVFLKSWNSKIKMQNDNSKYKIFEIISLVIIILNFILIYPMYHQTISQAEYLEKPATLKFIESREKTPFDYRIFGFGLSNFIYEKIGIPTNNDAKTIFEFQKEMLQPNLSLIFNVHSLDGYDSFMQERNSLFLGQIGSDGAVMNTGTELLDKADLTDQEKINLFISRLDLLALFNVKYIITPHQLQTAKLKLIYEGTATELRLPIYIYELQNYTARAYWPEKVKFVNIDNQSGLDLLLNSKDEILKCVFVECISNCQNQSESVKSNSLKILEYKSGYLEAIVNVEEDSWLVFNESNVCGWKSYIDSRETQIYSTNYLVQAILVPKGSHTVKFEFDAK